MSRVTTGSVKIFGGIFSFYSNTSVTATSLVPMSTPAISADTEIVSEPATAMSTLSITLGNVHAGALSEPACTAIFPAAPSTIVCSPFCTAEPPSRKM